MISKRFLSTAIVALATPCLVSGQFYVPCNLTTSTSCPPCPALGISATHDFAQGKWDMLKQLHGNPVTYTDKGAMFTMRDPIAGPTMESNKYIFFGRVEAELQSAPGAGIISAITLLSDDGDEIDFEWIGSQTGQVQTNYFGQAGRAVYDRGGFHSVSNPSLEAHKYAIEWTKDWVKWSIDGVEARVLHYKEAGSKKFPQSPMSIKIGIWSPDSRQTGSLEWAGGKPDFSKGPINAYFKSMTIVDYAGGDKPANGGVKEYVYGDMSGTWESIRVIDDYGNIRINENSGTKSSSHDDNLEPSTPIQTTSSLMALGSNAPESDRGSTRDQSEHVGEELNATSNSTHSSTGGDSGSSGSKGSTETPPVVSSSERILFSLRTTTYICLGALILLAMF